MITTNINDPVGVVQYGAYTRIDGDTNFPYVSVFRTRFPDQSTAYNNASAVPISAFEVDIYPKYALLTYQIGSSTSSSLTGSAAVASVNATEGIISPGSTTITALTGTGNFQKMWVYPIKSFATGVPTFNAGNVYIGKSGSAAIKYLPDILTPSGGPLLIQLPQGQSMPVTNIIIALTNTADGVFYSWT